MSSGIRREWIFAVVQECQIASGFAARPRELPLAMALGGLADRIPDPSSALETVMLRGVLLDFCLTWERADHRAHHAAEGAVRMPCGFAPGALIDEHWHDRRVPPKQALRRWASGYARAFQAAHPSFGAAELQRILEHRFNEPLGLGHVAAELGTSVRRLQLDFKRLTGRTPQEYLGLCRARAAVDMLESTDDKVEWIARAVGWSSRKNLNQALTRHVGLSPGGVRAAHLRLVT
jgi:AraC-like DNA-binding protein